MSLVQFLAANKSLFNVRNEPSPYRMSEENLLPKFGKGQASEEQSEVAISLPLEQKKNRVGKELEGTMKEPDTGRAKGSGGARSFPLGRWLRLDGWIKRKPAPTAKAVQGELRLDAVRPVRNDLHDSDLELAPSRLAIEGRAAQGAEMESASVTSGKKTSRWFGSSRS
jgi:hypothetical protein